MKIKIIELLNRIANGEEVPKKIFYKEECYRKKHSGDYATSKLGKYLTENIAMSGNLIKILNDEVEIIEEDKTIKELETKIVDTERKLIGTSGTKYSIRVVDNILINKINELVKEINKLKEN